MTNKQLPLTNQYSRQVKHGQENGKGKKEYKRRQ